MSHNQQNSEIFSDTKLLNVEPGLAAIGSSAFVSVGETFRVRLMFVTVASTTSNLSYLLQYQVNGTGWQLAQSTAQVNMVTSAEFVDGAVTTELLSTDPFVTGEGICSDRSSVYISLGAGYSTEIEWCVSIKTGNTGDFVQFRAVITSTQWTGGIIPPVITLDNYNVYGAVSIVDNPGGVNNMTIERATVYEGVQLGMETTPGTPVAATRRLLCLDIDPSPKTNIKPYRPMGFKASTALTKGKEYTTAKLTGMLAFNDIVYLLSSALCSSAAVATPSPVFTLTLGTQTSGTFTLTYGAQVTTGIGFNPTAQAIAAALEALSTIGEGNVFVVPTATANQFTISLQFAQGTAAGALTGVFTALTTPGNASITTQTAVLTKRWEFSPQFNQPDSYQTYTVEKGAFNVANFGAQMPFSAIAQLGIKFAENDYAISGDVVGQALTDPFTLTTAGVATVTKAPVNPGSASFYIGSTTNNLTQYLRVLELDFSMSPRYKPIMTQDGSKPSFSGLIEDSPMPKLKITVEHDAQAQALLAQMRSAATNFLRIECIGSQIEPGFYNRIMLTMPIGLTGDPRADKGGIYTSEFDAEVMYDAGFGGWIKAECDNTMAAL